MNTYTFANRNANVPIPEAWEDRGDIVIDFFEQVLWVDSGTDLKKHPFNNLVIHQCRDALGEPGDLGIDREGIIQIKKEIDNWRFIRMPKSAGGWFKPMRSITPGAKPPGLGFSQIGINTADKLLFVGNAKGKTSEFPYTLIMGAGE